MIHIACAADAAYLPHCAAMLDSVFAQHAAADITVHFLHDQALPDHLLASLAGFVQQAGAGWHPHDLEAQRVRFPANFRFGQVAWYRVLLPDLLPELERVLYLDADVIVCRPLDELWQADLEGCAAAVVINPLYPFMDTSFMTKLGLNGPAEYFNSGMLLMDLARFRAGGLTEQLLTFAAAQGARQEWPDQNALNVVLHGRCKYLPPTWNVQNTLFDLPPGSLPFTADEVAEARRAPAIVHYIGPYKPWHFRCKHRLRGLYWQHLRSTPWRDAALQGRSLWHGLFRLLPEQFGWRLEAWLKRKLRRL